MNIVELSVEIHSEIEGSQYRLYVDNDLLTERTFAYSHKHYIEEHIVLQVADGEHTIRVEPLRSAPVTAKNLKVETTCNATFVIA